MKFHQKPIHSMLNDKYYTVSLSVSIIVCLFACRQAPDQSAKTRAYATPVQPARKDFSHIRFASTLDLGCYMPLSAGIADTAIIAGKVYGFCSKECKAEFMQDPLANIKAGEARTHAKPQ